MIRLVALALVASVAPAACTIDDRGSGRSARPPEPARAEGRPGPATVRAAARPCVELRGRPPCGPGAEVGVAYPLIVSTRCGVRFARFDGRVWRAVPELVKGDRQPAGWDDRPEVGAMTLVSPTLARFTSKRGGAARFVPAGRVRLATCA